MADETVESTSDSAAAAAMTDGGAVTGAVSGDAPPTMHPSVDPEWQVVSRAETTADGEDLTATLVYALAEAEGVDPMELSPPLYDVVDVQDLAGMVPLSAADGFGFVGFTYDHYRVVVEVGGRVRVYERAD